MAIPVLGEIWGAITQVATGAYRAGDFVLDGVVYEVPWALNKYALKPAEAVGATLGVNYVAVNIVFKPVIRPVGLFVAHEVFVPLYEKEIKSRLDRIRKDPIKGSLSVALELGLLTKLAAVPGGPVTTVIIAKQIEKYAKKRLQGTEPPPTTPEDDAPPMQMAFDLQDRYIAQGEPVPVEELERLVAEAVSHYAEVDEKAQLEIAEQAYAEGFQKGNQQTRDEAQGVMDAVKRDNALILARFVEIDSALKDIEAKGAENPSLVGIVSEAKAATTPLAQATLEAEQDSTEVATLNVTLAESPPEDAIPDALVDRLLVLVARANRRTAVFNGTLPQLQTIMVGYPTGLFAPLPYVMAQWFPSSVYPVPYQPPYVPPVYYPTQPPSPPVQPPNWGSAYLPALIPAGWPGDDYYTPTEPSVGPANGVIAPPVPTPLDGASALLPLGLIALLALGGKK